MKDVKIRRAKMLDKFKISCLTKANKDTLDRNPQEITKLISNFFVAENQHGKIVGCCGYKLWDNDAEIISWIVDKGYQKKGLGKKILAKLLEDMKRRKKIKNIFVVTVPVLAKRYFQPFGFLKTGLQMFSGKVFADCQRCPKNSFRRKKYQCNEIALVLKNNR